MHELSLVEGILAIVREEMAKHGLTRLVRVRVKHGELSAVVPEALETAFEVLTVGTDLAGACLETEMVPLRVHCRQCGEEFSPPEEERFLMPCPACGTELGHHVLSGRELYIDHIEAE
ncbi:MAG: hydrogenase maturation nickel metallochaperone HypA [Desulfomicrobiaceae bacterium]|nr:hydrogenase maturation nickel metallochaperone HypA [Desulfomicrobiaceae bacterium]